MMGLVPSQEEGEIRALSLPCEDTEGSVCKPGRKLLPGTKSATTLILDCPASENKCLSLKPSSPWDFFL